MKIFLENLKIVKQGFTFSLAVDPEGNLIVDSEGNLTLIEEKSKKFYSSAMLGYWFKTELFNYNFMKKRPEQSHMEKRYSRFGRPLPDFKIIDVHEANCYFFNNNYFDTCDIDKFYDAVSKELKKHNLTLSLHHGDCGEILGVVVGICINGLTPKSVLEKEKKIQSASKTIKKICKFMTLPPLKVHPITTVYY